MTDEPNDQLTSSEDALLDETGEQQTDPERSGEPTSSAPSSDELYIAVNPGLRLVDSADGMYGEGEPTDLEEPSQPLAEEAEPDSDATSPNVFARASRITDPAALARLDPIDSDGGITGETDPAGSFAHEREGNAASASARAAPGERRGGGAQDEGQWVERALGLEHDVAAAQDVALRVSLLLEIGAIWRDELFERDAAASAYERALQHDPTSDEAFSALEGIYTSQNDYDKLVPLLLHGAERSESLADRLEYLRRVAQIYEDHGQPEKAVLVLETASDAMPDHPALAAEVHRLRAITAGLDAPHGEPSPPDPALQRAERAITDPITVLEQQLEQTVDELERADIYEQLASVWSRQRDNHGQAIDCLRRALQADPARASVLDALEEICLASDRAAEYARILEAQAHATASAPLKRSLLLRLAELCEGPLDDAGRALETYERLREQEPRDSKILERVARLARQLNRWDKLVEALKTLASHPRGEKEQAGLLHQLGSIYQHQLADFASAEHCYSEALEVDPAHLPTIARITELYGAAEQWSKLAATLERAEAYATQAGQRAELLFQAGTIYHERLRDQAAAAEMLERSLKIDPHRREAVALLGEIYWETRRLERLEPLLETLLRTVDPDAPRERLALVERLAETAEGLGQLERAIEHARAVRAIDPHSTGNLLRLARLARHTNDHGLAYEVCKALLALGEGLEDQERLRLTRQLAESARALGRTRESIEAFDLVVRNTRDREAQRALASLFAELGDWRSVVEIKQLMLAGASDEEAFTLHSELGDICAKQLNERERAESHYLQAVELQQDSRATLHRLIDLYSETKQWARTVSICGRLAEIEPDDKLKAKFHYAAAVIARDELKDRALALDLFNRTLDADPRHLKAFREVDDLLTKSGDWKALAQNYSAMIKRLPRRGYRKLKARLWQNLGEVLRTHRHDYLGAIEAFRAAVRLDPADLDLRHVLVELYQKGGASYRDELRTSCHELIELDPAETEPYHVLRRVYTEADQFDAAWCICAALSYLDRASDKEHSFYRQYRARTLLRATAQLTDEFWLRGLNHPAQDRHLNAILAVAARVVGEMTAHEHADFGLRRIDRADLNDDTQPVLVVARYVSAMLGVTHPDFHLHPEQPGTILMAHTRGAPSFVAGAHLLGRSSRREMAFVLAKQLTFLRPEHFLRYALNTPERLEAVLRTIFELCGRDYGPGHAAGKFERQAAAYLSQHLLRAEVERLAQLVEQLCSKGPVDLLKWWNATELTADRVGLLICGDIDVAARMIGAEPGGTGGHSRSERIKQLIQFLCSDAYFSLRERLGLTIAQQVAVGDLNAG